MLFSTVFSWFTSHAALNSPVLQQTQSMRSKGFFFEENRGQIPDKAIKFYGSEDGVYLFCKPGKISFVFTKIDKELKQISEATSQPLGFPLEKGAGGFDPMKHRASQPAKISVARMDFVLLNSNPSATISPSRKQDYFENFYNTGNADSGIAHVNTYKTITYKDIYPHIDLILSVAKKGIEYSFLVHPGGKVTDIQLRWDGADNSKPLANGSIKYDNQFGNIKETAPKSFAEGKELKSGFTRKKESYGFQVAKYDHTKDLLIDPTLVWATYFGGNDEDFGYAITTDLSGNIYITGSTRSTTGLATTGAFQTTYGVNSSGQYGYGDAFVAKFNSSGNLKWATYFGGSYEDDGYGIVTDTSGNVYITGATFSSDYIASSGAYQTNLDGPEDAFIAKFNASGARLWSTYYGGYTFDYGQAITIDFSGNLYITGTTRSNNGIATSGAYQTYYNSQGSNGEGFLAKFTSSGKLIWGTYHGGTSVGGNADYAWGVSADAFGNIYMSGYTNCTSGIATSGAYQTTMQGFNNTFLSKFNSSGNLIWGTYYGGNSADYGGSVCTDLSGNIYITGYTNSTAGVATTGAYQTVMAGLEDAFLAKFDSSGNLKWGTYYGGSNPEEAFGICSDAFGNVYISGETGSNSNIATTGAYQTSLIGNYDAFLAKFTGSGALAYATYYGGTGINIGYGVNVYRSGNIYVTGYTSSSNSIATPGAFHTTYSGGNYDAFLAKFGIKIKNDAGIQSIVNLGNNLCSDSGSFQLRLANYGNADLDSVNIFLSVNGIIQKQYHWFGQLQPDSTQSVNLGKFLLNYKTDTIRAWTSSPNGFLDSFPSNDSAILIDNQVNYPYANTGGNHAICQGNTITLGTTATVGHVYSWLSIPSGFTSSLSNPIVTPSITTTYYLKETVKNTTCKRIDSAKITVNPLPPATTGSPQSLCQTDSVSIGSSAITGDTYSWISVPSGFMSSNAKNKVSPAKTTLYYLTETITATGCYNRDSVQITVHQLPPAKTVFDQSICNGDSIAIGYANTSGDMYQWTSSPSGYHNNVSNPSVKPNKTTVYLLSETTSFGCTKNGSVDITVNSNPPSPNIRTKDSVCLGKSTRIQFHPPGYISYVWSSIPTGFTSNDSIINVSPVT